MMRRALRATALGAALIFGAAACGGSDDSSAEEPEVVPASPAEVSAGLKVVWELASDAARAVAAGDPEARVTAEEIEPAWVRIENTVRGNDLAAHSALALALTSLGTAVSTSDGAKASDAAAALHRAGDAYLAKFPADGSTPSPSASPGPSSTSMPTPS